jgi:hypothetical protein
MSKDGTNALDRFLSDLESLFSVTLQEVRKIMFHFHEEMRRGLAGGKSSLKMIPSSAAQRERKKGIFSPSISAERTSGSWPRRLMETETPRLRQSADSSFPVRRWAAPAINSSISLPIAFNHFSGNIMPTCNRPMILPSPSLFPWCRAPFLRENSSAGQKGLRPPAWRAKMSLSSSPKRCNAKE